MCEHCVWTFRIHNIKNPKLVVFLGLLKRFIGKGRKSRVVINHLVLVEPSITIVKTIDINTNVVSVVGRQLPVAFDELEYLMQQSKLHL